MFGCWREVRKSRGMRRRDWMNHWRLERMWAVKGVVAVWVGGRVQEDLMTVLVSWHVGSGEGVVLGLAALAVRVFSRTGRAGVCW